MPTAVVTGAFSYTGSAVARSLIARGYSVRTLTNRAAPVNDPGAPIEVRSLQFTDPKALAEAMLGARVFVNTYWVRYPYVGVSFDDAVENTALMLRAARDAGVERIVHVSVSNAVPDSPLAYYRGKARAEEVVRSLGVPYGIVRPTLVVGPHDILVNNIAWFLRRFPLFAMPGSGTYRLQPVLLDDAGEIVADTAEAYGDMTVDAAGPDTLTFQEMVLAIGRAIGRRPPIVHVPPWLSLQALRICGWFLGEVILSRQELDGLMTERLISHAPPLGRRSVLEWLQEHGDQLGRTYASEFARHVPGRVR